MLLSSSIRQFVRHRFPVATLLVKKYIILCNEMQYWYMCKKYHCDEELRKYKGCSIGKRCFIIGNGPSLKAQDLEQLMNEDSFACNHIEKIFNRTQWRPRFYTVVDPYFTSDIDFSEFKDVFLSAFFIRKHKKYRGRANCINSKNIKRNEIPIFIEDITRHVNSCATAVFVNIQLAVYMGYSKIYLLGVDHDWAYTLDTKSKVSVENANKHFYSNKEMDSKTENNPFDLQAGNAVYQVTKEYCDTHNIQIYNATRGGKLEIFERINFDELFADCK